MSPSAGESRVAVQGGALTAMRGETAYRAAAAAVPGAAFISQLIAEREHLPPQRERRRAPVATALTSYEAAGQRAVPRLPAGYRRSLSV